MSALRSPRLVLLTLAFAACRGQGSDLGPNLNRTRPPLPLQVTLRDDQSRAVCGALVRTPVGDAVSGSAGRAEVAAVMPSPGLVTVVADAASATASDQLVGFTCAVAPVDGGAALPRALFLPDLSASVGLPLSAGSQSVAVSLDDSATSGATLAIDAGAVVNDGSATSLTLRSGSLRARHLPVDLPTTPGTPMLASRGVMIAPVTATFTPGATLSLPDDLGAQGSSAVVELYRLDEQSGRFVRVAAASAGGGQLSSAPQAVQRGGLYVFAAVAARTTELSGRVLDVDGSPVANVIVQAGGVTTRSTANGTFTLGPLVPVDFGDNARVETLELIGGRGMLPVHALRDFTLSDGAMPLGDVTLDTRPSAHLRVLAIERGRLLTNLRLRTSQGLRESAAAGFAGNDGAVVFEDMAVGIYGFLGARSESLDNCFRLESALRINPLDRFYDARVFSLRTNYDERRRGTVAFARDSAGGGPVEGVVMVRGVVPEQGFVGRTLESGSLFLGIDTGDHLTAVADTTRDGQRVISAFTVVGTSAHRLEMPVRTTKRASLGAFDRHGLVAGELLGATPGRDRALRVSHPLSYADWVERTLGGGVQLSSGRAPVKRAPGGGATVSFLAGVPRPRGHLALVETGNDGALASAFVAFDQAPAEASVASLVGTLAPAGEQVIVLRALQNLDARLPQSALRYDWAVARGGTVVDMARGLRGVGLTLFGPNATVQLPARSGDFAGVDHVLHFYGEAIDAGTTIRQAGVTTATQTSAVPLLPVPQVSAPVPGASVDANGFRVAFSVDPAAVFVTVELRSEVAGELREWTAIAPGYVTFFDFRKLPGEATAVLVPGRSWRLKLTAFGLLDGPVFSQRNPYNSVIANWVSMPLTELGVRVTSSVEFTITTP